jgi:hypothetical protein
MTFTRYSAVVLALLVAAGAAAQSPDQSSGAPDDRPEGATPLFDGETLAGWRGGTTYDPRTITPEQQAEWDAAVPAHWRVENGELVSDGQEPHLVTARDYGDFELWVEWKLAPKGDSGIYLRGCPQVQIWDPTNVDAHDNGSDKGSGALWNNETHERWPSEVADLPVGQWNKMYVRMVGEYVTVVLNGKTVVDNVVLENYYDRKAPVPARGPIHLQTHGSEMRFRNLYIREIAPAMADEMLVQIRGGDDAFEPLFNGKDFTGWIGATDSYEIVDGAIRCKAGHGGNLLTEREYGNFIVRFQFQLPPGGNNGLAIRSPSSDIDAAYEGLELQVLDDTDPKWTDLHDYQYHGSVYGLAPAHRGYLRPAGEWNYQEVVVDGDRVEVHLNGVSILDVDLAEVRERPVDGNEHPGASRTSGHFGFAGHNDPVMYRDIRIKELP